MALNRRYAVTLPGSIGGQAPPTVILVELTDELGPGGSPVWVNVESGLRVEIDGGVAVVLAGYDGHPCLFAIPQH